MKFAVVGLLVTAMKSVPTLSNHPSPFPPPPLEVKPYSAVKPTIRDEKSGSLRNDNIAIIFFRRHSIFRLFVKRSLRA